MNENITLDTLISSLSNIGATVFFEYTALDIIINILISLFCGFVVASLYKKNHSGLSFSSGFSKTLVYITFITCVIMMIIGGSVARAFALVGAMSIVRFRTVLKDPLDLSFIFVALVLGMGSGTSNYQLVLISLIIFIILTLILNGSIFFYNTKSKEIILNFNANESILNKDNKKVYEEELNKKTKFLNLVSISTEKDGFVNIVYNLEIADNSSENEIIKILHDNQHINEINILKNDTKKQNY